MHWQVGRKFDIPQHRPCLQTCRVPGKRHSRIALIMKAFISLFCLVTTTAWAQVPRLDPIVSPEVHGDRRVTFRIRATNATEVILFGDWMKPETKLALTHNDEWIWSATVGPLEPGLAIYVFTVDGVTTPDPVNPRIKLRARTSASLVDVPGNSPELWEAR